MPTSGIMRKTLLQSEGLCSSPRCRSHPRRQEPDVRRTSFARDNGVALNMIGTILSNRYKLISELGSGGMAWVYLAEDLREGQKVAVKILYPQLGKDIGFVQRFSQEAKLIITLTQSLSETHIVRILDYGSHRDTRYLVMEYVPGRDLRQVLDEEGPLPWRQALDIGRQVLLALQHAYCHGIVHRDIKPANIMLLSDGTVRVLDFGIARARTSPTLTHSGFVGSPHYVSPEQAMGRRVDIRADLYSLGIVLYEMLTGDRPFQSDTPWATINHHIATPPSPLEEARPDLPASLARLLRKALAKRPEDRFQTPATMAQAVDSSLSNQAQDSDSWAIEPDAKAALLNALYEQAQQAAAIEQWRDAVDLLSQILRIDPRFRDVTDKLAEAGRQARFAALYDAAQVSMTAGHWESALAQLDEISYLAPEYRDIQALRAQASQAMQSQQPDYQDGQSMEPGKPANPAPMTDPVDRLFVGGGPASESPDPQIQESAGQSSQTPFPRRERPSLLRFVPRRRQALWGLAVIVLLCFALTGFYGAQIEDAPAVAAEIPTDGLGTIHVLASSPVAPVYLPASHDATLLSTTPVNRPPHTPERALFSPTHTPPPSQIVTPGPTAMPSPTRELVRPASARPRGQIVFPRFDPARSTYDVYVCSVDGANCHRVAAEASQPHLLPDGTRLVIHSWKSDYKGLFVLSLSGQRLWRISDRIEAARPSSDFTGNAYVYHSRHEINRLPYLYLTEGTEPRPILREAIPVLGQSPSWLPDGRILYSGCVGDDCGIIVSRTDGSHSRQVVAGSAETNPVASPDGRRVAFMSQRDGNWEVYVVNLDGEGLTRLTHNPGNDGLPTWSPDGQYIAFVSDRDGAWAVWVTRPDGSSQRRLFGIGGPLDGQVRDAAPHEIQGWVEERISWGLLP